MSIIRGQSRAGRSRFGGQQFETAGDESLPPVPSARQLARLWAARDARYARRKVKGVLAPLSEREQESVIGWRRREADALAGLDRSVALAILSRWAPPRVTV